MLITTIIETIRVFQIFAIFYLLIPLFFMKSSNKNVPILDRFFFGFVCEVFFQIVAVHVLVLMKLFDVISLSVLIAIPFVISVRADHARDMYITKFFAKGYLVFDVFDLQRSRTAFLCQMKINLRQGTKQLAVRFQNLWKPPVFSFLFLGVLILSACIRFHHSLVHYAYPHLDMYLHLKWVKALMSNNLYLDNTIYPKGMHSVIAFLSELTYSDPYWILRYFGPFFCILLVISIYFLAVKITGNRYLSLLAMAIYGLSVNNDFLTSQVFRQTATMPQEFGMLFIILGYAFLIDFIQTQSRRHLFAFEVCLMIGLMSHSFSGVFLIFWAAVAVIVSVISGTLSFHGAVRFTWISAAVSAASFVPLVLGRLLGKEFQQSSFEMITDISGIKILDFDFAGYFSKLLFPDSFLMTTLIYGGMVFLAASIFMRRANRTQKRDKVVSLLISTGILYLIFRIPLLIDAKMLPELLGEGRTGPFLSLLLPISAAVLVFYLMDDFLYISFRMPHAEINKLKSLFGCAMVLCFAVVSIVTGNYTLKTFYNHMEYDQAAEAYVRIKAEFYKKENTDNWYIVSTDPQLAEATGYGWYDEGYRFVFDYTKDEVMNPDFRFDFPVNNVFIFVEKVPLFYDKPISTEYGTTELEPLGADPFMQYYQDGDNRAVMEAHIWMLADAYASTHKNVSVYYEDKNFKIYRIYQEIVGSPQE